ncbi:MAG: hypothetical protein WCC10_00650 [Tumebacillaceae bacterium]
MKKICFAILVHEKREIVEDLVENVRYFCPNSTIVLYNGGYDATLCHGLGVPVCPASKKLHYGMTALYMLETMKWVHESGIGYDYLITMDSDALFAKRGFEEWVEREMQDADFMGFNAGTRWPGWDPWEQILQEWEKWREILNTDNFDFLGVFGVGQTFSRDAVDRFLNFERIAEVQANLQRTTAWGIDEVIFVNLARRLGLRLKSYPLDRERNEYDTTRYRPYFTADEVRHCVRHHPHGFLYHPVHRDLDDEARVFVQELRK